MADPAIVAKATNGRPVTHCVGANVCAKRLVSNLPVACVLNPRMGREEEPARKREAHGEPGRLAIVGAGPAGLKAAAAAAHVGHEVTLFERADEPGGRIRLLCPLPLRSNWEVAIRDMAADAEASGATVLLGTEATLDNLRALQPDHVLVATGSEWETTGATPFRPERDHVPGLEATNAELVPLDVAVGRCAQNPLALGERILIVDESFDSAAAALAILTAEGGANVTILTPAPGYADHLFQTYELPYFMKRFESAAVRILCGVALDALGTGGRAEAGSLYSDHRHVFEKVDAVVFAAGRVPRRDLVSALAKAGIAATLIGDAKAPRSIEAAIRDGYRAGATFQTANRPVPVKIE